MHKTTKEDRRLTQYTPEDEPIVSEYGTIPYKAWLVKELARLGVKGWQCEILPNCNPKNIALFRV